MRRCRGSSGIAYLQMQPKSRACFHIRHEYLFQRHSQSKIWRHYNGLNEFENIEIFLINYSIWREKCFFVLKFLRLVEKKSVRLTPLDYRIWLNLYFEEKLKLTKERCFMHCSASAFGTIIQVTSMFNQCFYDVFIPCYWYWTVKVQMKKKIWMDFEFSIAKIHQYSDAVIQLQLPYSDAVIKGVEFW